MRFRVLFLYVFLLAIPASQQATSQSRSQEFQHIRPRLILQITVDQLRSDLVWRYEDRFGEGGFRRLIDGGTVYLDAHHGHANTETIVGHTTLSTGADPSAHGMIGNVWLDRATGTLRYNIEDARYPILTAGAGVDQATELDPTQRAARSDGRSPSAIQVSTFSDEFRLFYGKESKVFAVSVKDRGAVSMAGHMGKAFWFSKQKGEFVTSKYYYDEYPGWVVEHNDGRPAEAFSNITWGLLHDRATYRFRDQDDRPYETSLPGFGRIFPHDFGDSTGKYFTTFLTLSPAGDQMTADFARAILTNEHLGEDEIPDYLSVSFSSTDYVGHIFGPSSLEAEDNILQLDKTLAGLFDFIDETIGLQNTLIVLSADHGGPEAPGYLTELGFDTDYIHPDEFDRAPAIEALKKQFGIGDELITTYYHPYLYLNRDLIAARGLDQGEVESAIAAEVTKFDGVAVAISSTALTEGLVPGYPILKAILRNFSPSRSGDIYVVFEPNRFINDFDGLTVAATHGSPWRYDTHVPLMMAGPGIRSQFVSRHVETVDLARTLSLLIGAKVPSGAVGKPLVEVFRTP